MVFPPAGTDQIVCTDVSIVSDGTLEEEEIFCLNLSSSDPNVSASATTCIVIADSDSKL